MDYKDMTDDARAYLINQAEHELEVNEANIADILSHMVEVGLRPDFHLPALSSAYRLCSQVRERLRLLQAA